MRVLLLGLIAAVLLADHVTPQPGDYPSPIVVDVEAGNDVSVTVPGLTKETIAGLVVAVIARSGAPPEAKRRLQETLSKASSLTFVVTTKR